MRTKREKERTPYQRKRARIVDVPVAVPQQAVRSYVPRPLSGTSAQAMRTGGWADPARGGELKFIDTYPQNSMTFNSSIWYATPRLLNGCIQGTESINRIGRKIHMKSIYMRYSFALASTSTGGGVLRILVVYDKQANATAPAITDILLADEFHAPNNLSNRDRFVTLMDVLTEPISTGSLNSVSGVEYRKINLEAMFNTGNAGTIGDITSGSVYLFTCTNGTILTANSSFGARVRIKFTDM